MDERVESLAAPEGRLFVLLQVRGEPFALPSGHVRAVTPVGRITRVLRTPRNVRGVANWRGKVLTLYDLGEDLGLPGRPAPAPYAVVLAPKDEDYDVGILAEQVREVRAIPEDLLESLSSGGSLFHGVIHLDGIPVMILDPKPLLHRLAMAVLSDASPG
ncbi:MAG: chemotaxis protein CheW [Candidatus Methylomirabilales bacterium]